MSKQTKISISLALLLTFFCGNAAAEEKKSSKEAAFGLALRPFTTISYALADYDGARGPEIKSGLGLGLSAYFNQKYGLNFTASAPFLGAGTVEEEDNLSLDFQFRYFFKEDGYRAEEAKYVFVGFTSFDVVRGGTLVCWTRCAFSSNEEGEGDPGAELSTAFKGQMYSLGYGRKSKTRIKNLVVHLSASMGLADYDYALVEFGNDTLGTPRGFIKGDKRLTLVPLLDLTFEYIF